MTEEVPHQDALLGKGELRLHRHDHNEGEEAEDVNEAATESGDVGLVEEGADQVAEGQDAQTVVAKVQEKQEAVTVGQDAAVLQDQREDDDGQGEVGGALEEPSEEVAERVDSHHFHVLWEKREKIQKLCLLSGGAYECLQQRGNTKVRNQFDIVALFRSSEGKAERKDSIITGHLGKQRSWCSLQKYDDGSDHFSSKRKLYLVQPQLSLVHQLLHKISHKQNPGHHQHEREDKRDGLQIPGGIQRCQLSVKLPEHLPSNHCQQRQMKRPIIQSRA